MEENAAISVEVKALSEASQQLDDVRKSLASGPMPMYRMVSHARDHVDSILAREFGVDAWERSVLENIKAQQGQHQQ